MKTIKFIDQEIKDIVGDNSKFVGKHYVKNNPKESKVVSQQLRFLRDCKTYLQTNPSQAFIESEIERLRTLIVNIESRYDVWHANNCTNNNFIKNPKAKFRDEFDLAKLENQLNTLLFILL